MSETSHSKPSSLEGLFIELLPDLQFSERDIAGRRGYVCQHGEQGRYYHFGAAEYEVARLCDGSRTFVEVYQAVQETGIDWTPEDLGRFATTLMRSGLAKRVGEPEPMKDPLEHARSLSPAAPAQGQILSKMTRGLSHLLTQRLDLIEADRIAAPLAKITGFAFAPPGVALWSLLVASGLGLGVLHRIELGQQLRHFLAPQSWPWLMLLWCVIKVAHEAGHAVAARRQGIVVGRAGILFFLFTPLVFVNVTNAWRLPSRWARMQIALAGIYVELAIAAVAVWVWWVAPGETTRYLAAQVALLAGPATVLVNANPLLRLDGYYVLSDLLSIPNLRMHGRKQLVAHVEHLAIGRTPRPSLLPSWRASAATVHAGLSVLFQMAWMAGLILAVSIWARGLGMILAIAAVTLWGVVPLVRWLVGLWRAEDWEQIRLRLALTGGSLAVSAAFMALAPSPLYRRIPAVVSYQDEQVARAAADGFVKAVHLNAGDRVAVGDLILEMDNAELRLHRDLLAIECEASRLRARQLNRRGRTALNDAERERLESLQRRLAEVQRQVDALRVYATRPGTISGSRLADLVGQYVHQGEVLARIGSEEQKELLASIEGSDLETYLSAARTGNVQQVRLRDGTRFDVVITAPQPRVSSVIPHPALAASAGGPLPIKASHATSAAARDNPATELVAPRSQSVSALDAATAHRVRAGQQGILVIGDTRSLWHRITDAVAARLERL